MHLVGFYHKSIKVPKGRDKCTWQLPPPPPKGNLLPRWDYQLVSQGSLALMVVIWVFFSSKILESRMTEQKCLHYHISKWRSLMYQCAMLLAVLWTESRTHFFGWVCNCGRINCWRVCRSDLKTDALSINPCWEGRLLPSLLLPAILNTVGCILWFPCFHLLATVVLRKCQHFRRPFTFNEYYYLVLRTAASLCGGVTSPSETLRAFIIHQLTIFDRPHCF